MKAVTSAICTAGSVDGSQGGLHQKVPPAAWTLSSMFSGAKSGPLSGSKCEGMGRETGRGKDTSWPQRREEEEEEGREQRGKKVRISQSSSAAFLCVLLNGEQSADAKRSEGKQCRLTRHHWLIISNLSRA